MASTFGSVRSFITLSEDFIEKVYEKIVKKDESYFKKHLSFFETDEGCPSDRWRRSWKNKDFPRCVCILDFKEWSLKYFGGGNHVFSHLGYTHEGDPELDFIKSLRRTRLDYPPYDLHTIFKGGANENLKETFDFFLFNQTLEHLYNPFLAVKNIYDMVKPGGFVFTSVPTLNIPHLMPFHFNGFTPMGLALLFLSCGFEVIEVGQFGNEDYIKQLWKTHEWPDYTFLKSVATNGEIQNEERNVCQCWILAKKTFCETSYEDTFTDLNPSFGRNDDETCLRHTRGYDHITEYSFLRRPPKFLGSYEDVDAVYKFLSRRFGKSEKVLKNVEGGGHTLIYKKQSLTFDYRYGNDKKIVIDVNYKWADTYYHFLTEVVPNVLFALSKLKEGSTYTLKEDVIVYVKIIPEFTLQWFDRFGIAGKCFLITDTLEHVLWKNRVTCRFIECGNVSPERVSLVRDALKTENFETTCEKINKRIGVFMRRCGDREIMNEEEVLDTLIEIFKDEVDQWVIFTTLSPEKTVHLFSRASVVVGPHGAGFTNLLFCKDPSNVKVVELAPISHAYVCYWHLCEVLRVKDYVMIPSRDCDPSYRFFVNCEEMKKLLLSHYLQKNN